MVKLDDLPPPIDHDGNLLPRAEWPKPQRRDGTPFPRSEPEGWVHLSEAVARFAAALFQEKWQNVYLPCLQLADDLEDDSADEKVMRSVREAEYLIEQFTDACRLEYLRTGCTEVGWNSEVTPIPAQWWDTEDRQLRFRSWSIDPANPLSAQLSLPCWIWVERKSLELVCDDIALKVAGIGKCHIMMSDRYNTLDVALFLASAADTKSHASMPPGASVLVPLFASGRVRTWADKRMRFLRVAGRGELSRPIERNEWCPVPSDDWQSFTPNAFQNWAKGNFLLEVGERSVVRLEGLKVDCADLMDYLNGLGYRFEHDGRAVVCDASGRLVISDVSDKSPSPPSALAATPVPVGGKRGRSKGSGGFAHADALIAARMRKLIEADPDLSPWAAAESFLSEVKGGGGPDSKRRRIVDRYKQIYGTD